MKKIILYAFILCSVPTLEAQKILKEAEKYQLTDSIQTTELVRKFWAVNRETSYLSFLPFVTSIKDRRIPMRNGEGTKDYHLVEAFLNFSFPLFYGKDTHKKLLALEYTSNFRMTLDESKPLTPGSHHIGFSYYQILSKKTIPEKPDEFRFSTLRVQAKHYSNGQAPGFFYFDPNDNTNFRNSYLDGDFSTNYLSVWYTKGTYRKKPGSLHQMTFGYRHDLGSEESTFAFSKEQENSYGRHRFLFLYDYRTKRFNKDYEHHFRVRTEYIAGNLGNFNSNLENDSNKHRFSIRGTYELAPKKFYAVGFFLSTYYGRDYLNIRYDDIIYSIQLGITLNLDKFFL